MATAGSCTWDGNAGAGSSRRARLQSDYDIGDVKLLPQGLLEGKLVDSEGHAIVRAEVTLRGVASDFSRLVRTGSAAPRAAYYLSRRRTRTANDGTFRVAGLAAGDYEVHAKIDDDSAEIDHGPYAVHDGEVTVTPDLVVDFGIAIEGVVRVHGRAGLPVGGTLTLRATDEKGRIRNDTVAPDGTFRIERLMAGSHAIYSLEPVDGFGVVPLHGVAAGSRDIVIDLAPLTTIEGSVIDADGKPVTGAVVSFFPKGIKSTNPNHTDEQGCFCIDVAAGVIGNVGARDPSAPHRRIHQLNVIAGTHGIVLKLPK